MKTLVLVNYPLLEKVGRMAEPGYIVNRKAVPAWTIPHLIHDKRFNDAELAAEYWRASSGADEVNYDRRFGAGSINSIIHRFATLPHYDEDQS